MFHNFNRIMQNYYFLPITEKCPGESGNPKYNFGIISNIKK